jgi:hypothetical protein
MNQIKNAVKEYFAPLCKLPNPFKGIHWSEALLISLFIVIGIQWLVIAYSTGQWWPPAITFYAAWKTYQYEKLLAKEKE